MENKRLLSLALIIASTSLWAESSLDELQAEARAMGKIACSMAGSDLIATADETTGVMALCKDGEISTSIQLNLDGEVWIKVVGQDTFIRVLPDGKVVANKPNDADGGILSIQLLVDGTVEVFPIVDKVRHGASTIRFLNGMVLIVPHVEGTMNGPSVIHAPDGRVTVTPFVDGKPHGRIVNRGPDGEVRMHEAVMGEHEGEVITHPASKSALGQ